ncbi:alpha/beta fold hydrolase, partial [Sciscionella sediminilitoris]|uniref:alpha/beta fold hydrolase n=1 Tax=Sciscionella sediminilitoris TaxID=1445613 RepID=UPI0004DF7594
MRGTLASGLCWQSYGSGDPVTLVVPGLGATSGEARLPASGLPGTRVVATLPGHGDAADAPAGYWSYSRVAEDIAELADATGARAAIGTSLGTGALLHLLAEEPGRFAAAGLLLPGALDAPRESPAMRAFAEFASAVEDSDLDRLRGLVEEQLPDGVDVGGYVEARTTALARIPEAMRAIPNDAPVPEPGRLAAVTAPV